MDHFGLVAMSKNITTYLSGFLCPLHIRMRNVLNILSDQHAFLALPLTTLSVSGFSSQLCGLQNYSYIWESPTAKPCPVTSILA